MRFAVLRAPPYSSRAKLFSSVDFTPPHCTVHSESSWGQLLCQVAHSPCWLELLAALALRLRVNDAGALPHWQRCSTDQTPALR